MKKRLSPSLSVKSGKKVEKPGLIKNTKTKRSRGKPSSGILSQDFSPAVIAEQESVTKRAIQQFKPGNIPG